MSLNRRNFLRGVAGVSSAAFAGSFLGFGGDERMGCTAAIIDRVEDLGCFL